MTTINVGDLHDKLAAAGIPVITVRLTREMKIELELADATDAQKAEAQVLVDGYDQAAVDAAKVQPVTLDDFNDVKTVADMKALLIKMYLAKE